MVKVCLAPRGGGLSPSFRFEVAPSSGAAAGPSASGETPPPTAATAAGGDVGAARAARPRGESAGSSGGGGGGALRRGRRWRLTEMGTAQVLKALRQLGLDEHAAAFSRCEVSGWMCDLLDDDLLQHKLGVTQPQQRATFLKWVASMQLRPLPPVATAAGSVRTVATAPVAAAPTAGMPDPAPAVD